MNRPAGGLGVVVLAAGLVLAGCETTGAGSAAAPSAASASLALDVAELNAEERAALAALEKRLELLFAEDSEAYAAFIHPDATTWNGFNAAPTPPQVVISLPYRMIDYRIIPLTVFVADGFAVINIYLSAETEDKATGERTRATLRMQSVSRKEGDLWQLISAFTTND